MPLDPPTAAASAATGSAAAAGAEAELFARLAATIYGSDTPEDVYQAITSAAVDLVSGCHRACIMLLEKDGLHTVGATDDIAWRIDQYEKLAGEGPCVDAIMEEAFQLDPDIRDSTPWPKLAAVVLEHTPVKGMLGFRLLIDGRKAGALNMFSDDPGVLDASSADQGAVIAAFASVALMTLSARREVQELRAGLASNREIGKAVGLLMAAHRVTADEAFAILRKTSQDLNIKLASVAELVVQGRDDQAKPRSGMPSSSPPSA